MTKYTIVERYNYQEGSVRQLDFRWNGFTCDAIELFDEHENRCGYIMSTYIPQDIFKEKYSDFPGGLYMGFDFHNGDGALNPNNSEEENYRHYYKKRFFLENQNLTILSPEQKNRVFQNLHKKYKDQLRFYMDFYVDNPFVEYIRLYEKEDLKELIFPTEKRETRQNNENFQNKGLSVILYTAMAKMLARQNMTLRSSGMQSPQAQLAWLRMVKEIPEIGTVKIPQKEKEFNYYILDGNKIDYKMPNYIESIDVYRTFGSKVAEHLHEIKKESQPSLNISNPYFTESAGLKI